MRERSSAEEIMVPLGSKVSERAARGSKERRQRLAASNDEIFSVS